jgi:hypothetical protein
MKQLLQFFVDLCLLRTGPQELPASALLFWLLLPINLALGMLLIGDSLDGLDRAFFAAMVDLFVMLGWTGMLLVFKRHQGRFLQTVTAMLGMGVLLGSLALPLQIALGSGAAGADADAGFVEQFLSMLLLFVMVWSMVVTGHVYRHALDVSLGLGMGLALSYSVVTTLLIGMLFPLAGG